MNSALNGVSLNEVRTLYKSSRTSETSFSGLALGLLASPAISFPLYNYYAFLSTDG